MTRVCISLAYNVETKVKWVEIWSFSLDHYVIGLLNISTYHYTDASYEESFTSHKAFTDSLLVESVMNQSQINLDLKAS